MSVNALIGRKVGMTSIFDATGSMLGVSVIELGPNQVVARRTIVRDGYEAVALGFGKRKPSRVGKPQLMALKKSGIEIAPQVVSEVEIADGADPQVGEMVSVADVFQVGAVVDVVGTSLGKGFAGVHKRHHHDLGPKSHGTKNIREHKSTGSNTHPSRRWPGTSMAGHMGAVRRTVRNLTVVGIDAERGIMLVNGPVPGCASGVLLVRRTRAKHATKPAGK
ncbi:MAG: 50S ribosomal protein L3 [Planctomycetes bacterium]|nr:50S ribosomal protein L3 [Planctomycetota bacterium]